MKSEKQHCSAEVNQSSNNEGPHIENEAQGNKKAVPKRKTRIQSGRKTQTPNGPHVIVGSRHPVVMIRGIQDLSPELQTELINRIQSMIEGVRSKDGHERQERGTQN